MHFDTIQQILLGLQALITAVNSILIGRNSSKIANVQDQVK